MEIRIDLKEPKILDKVTNDRMGLFVANEWRRLIEPYTPKDTGLLMQNVELSPWTIKYIEPYAAYVYFGEMYVDPKYGIGGFFSPDYGFWSRPGVEKIPSGKKLEYQKNNPYSTDHWDIKAAEAGQVDKLAQAINNIL